ncbi:hypothetical protein ZIOFF_026302 [Zingiber officinale]|uniref:Copine C-terminal domain-containing protein n=1 Tax=Zingiber officinale TaxID=94328 RepID=A0A8J5LKE0_ZINOF|nr:hypothetical protein ZIOFF_026302 [Zingiber officinale]
MDSEFPSSILLVGVGDGPWDMMKEFDDNIPARSYDNFQVKRPVELNSTRKEAPFSLAALMEIPSQYKATIDMGILGCRTGKSPRRAPLLPPTGSQSKSSFGDDSFKSSNFHQSSSPYSGYRAETSARTAPTSAFEIEEKRTMRKKKKEKKTQICVSNTKKGKFFPYLGDLNGASLLEELGELLAVHIVELDLVGWSSVRSSFGFSTNPSKPWVIVPGFSVCSSSSPANSSSTGVTPKSSPFWKSQREVRVTRGRKGGFLLREIDDEEREEERRRGLDERRRGMRASDLPDQQLGGFIDFAVVSCVDLTSPSVPALRRRPSSLSAAVETSLGWTAAAPLRITSVDPYTSELDFEATEGLARELFGRLQGLLYTITDAAVSSSEVVEKISKQSDDWLTGITNYLETVLKLAEQVQSSTVLLKFQKKNSLQYLLMVPTFSLSDTRHRTCLLFIHLALWTYHWLHCSPSDHIIKILASFLAILMNIAGHTFKGPRPLATAVFVIGFWLLDVANNTVQGPIRALLADLSGPDQCNSANSIFCSWMAFGNILGFASGASGLWHKYACQILYECISCCIYFCCVVEVFSSRWFPFLTTKACCEVCGNLKAAFLVAVLFLLLCMSVTLYFAKEIPLEPKIRQHLSDSSPLLKDSEQYLGQFEGDETEKVDSGTLHVNNMRSKGGVTNSLDLEHHKNRDQSEAFNDGPASVLVNILTSLTHLPPGMHSVLLVMSLSWVMTSELSWFPFFLFDTDWMGREVYHGDPMGDITERTDYQTGVREGAIGLLLNSVRSHKQYILAFLLQIYEYSIPYGGDISESMLVGIVSSFFVDPMCCKMGAKLVWAMSNFAVFICMAAATILNLVSTNEDTIASQHVLGGNNTVKAAALVIFSVLGFPLAIAYSVPFSMTAELTAGTGGGQGLATGVLNLAIVVPQTIVAIGAGPWDALFGGGNIPAFALPSIFSFAGGILAALKLPKLSSSHTSVGFHGFG